MATVSSDDIGRFESAKSGTAWEVVTIGYEFGTRAEKFQEQMGCDYFSLVNWIGHQTVKDFNGSSQRSGKQ